MMWTVSWWPTLRRRATAPPPPCRLRHGHSCCSGDTSWLPPPLAQVNTTPTNRESIRLQMQGYCQFHNFKILITIFFWVLSLCNETKKLWKRLYLFLFSGKTAAFLVPLLQGLGGPKKKGFRAVVLAPTRELASQIHRSVHLPSPHSRRVVSGLYFSMLPLVMTYKTKTEMNPVCNVVVLHLTLINSHLCEVICY